MVRSAALVALAATLVVVAASPATLAQTTAGAQSDSQSMGQSLLEDPVSRDKVLSLKDDPLVNDILQDEATMRAVQSGDLDALSHDPKIRALLRAPTVRELIDRHKR
jgi:hypothetical protein